MALKALVPAVFVQTFRQGRLRPGQVALRRAAIGIETERGAMIDGTTASERSSSAELTSSRIPLDKVEVNAMYLGTVVNTTGFGAYVDIGAEVDGLLHNACVRPGRYMPRLQDELQPGQQIQVWVRLVAYRRLGLAMVKEKCYLQPTSANIMRQADLRPFAQLIGAGKIRGRVTQLEYHGIMVKVAPADGSFPLDGWLPRSLMKCIPALQEMVREDDTSFKQMSDYFKIDMQLEVYVKNINRADNKIVLELASPPEKIYKEVDTRKPMRRWGPGLKWSPITCAQPLYLQKRAKATRKRSEKKMSSQDST